MNHIGDRVTLYRNQCNRLSGGKAGDNIEGCKKIKLGSGEITRLLNEHYSVMKVDSGVAFEDGTLVEKN